MKFRKIEISELSRRIPNYKKIAESKDIAVYQWLKNWITEGLKNKTLKTNELLPSKSDLAYHLGVSVGTVQNAIRYLEDEGYFESKQRIGTLIKDTSSSDSKFRKLTSKREKVIFELKKLIVDKKYKVGDLLPSGKELSAYLGSSSNTTRLALENLEANGFITTNCTKGLEAKRFVAKIPVINSDSISGTTNSIETETLVNKVETDLKDYINQNYKIGQKLCAHSQLAEKFGVSIKTVHDALKSLIEAGYLSVHRGRYGTVITELPNKLSAKPRKEDTIFAPAADAAFYNYQKVENHIKNLIRENYNIGDKLPSMEFLAKDFNVSTNTIKKGLQNIYNQGYVRFERGRYGGTFVTDIPETVNEAAFKWLAVNPEYVKVYKNQ